jgi:hypothetical protein
MVFHAARSHFGGIQFLAQLYLRPLVFICPDGGDTELIFQHPNCRFLLWRPGLPVQTSAQVAVFMTLPDKQSPAS